MWVCGCVGGEGKGWKSGGCGVVGWGAKERSADGKCLQPNFDFCFSNRKQIIWCVCERGKKDHVPRVIPSGFSTVIISE